ncbi:MAG: hypothetical protein A2Y24_03835 [Clostridiales bacterium GWE2_32_10]|nr:MAG: hypothetical protein A2Y24_03835 [Clostridiales bacterium GWE2_32_10]HBY19599.1 hypothetical protein [Clostridiales bacterium]
MKLTSFNHFIGEGFEGVFKNKSMAFASIATTAVCILMLGIAFLTMKNIEFNVENIETDINITVFLDEKMTEDEVSAFKGIVLKNSEIESIDYISKDEALKRFVAETGLPEELASDLVGALRASFEIKLRNNKDEQSVIDVLSQMEQIVKINTPREAMKLLIDLKNFIQATSIAIISILVVVGVILIGNTIQLTVYIRRNEIKIMKYIGATDWFVRWPFIIEGLFIGFFGTIIPLIILFFAYNFFVNIFNQAVSIDSEKLIDFMPIMDVYQELVPIALILGLGMGIVGSMIIIRRHLRA